MDSDERLFARVRSGDLSAFDELYARYERALYGFLMASLKNRADAEDVFHDAFLNALKSRAVTFEEGGFRAWLFRIARNAVLNRQRSSARGAAAKARVDAPEPHATAVDRIEEHERDVALRSAVARLPASLAEIYRLRTSGLSYDEIADVLETPVGTVKSRMHEMVKLLRKEMDPWTARG
jgi:RNA polymerase sigma-70 factor (ECF subfamily)